MSLQTASPAEVALDYSTPATLEPCPTRLAGGDILASGFGMTVAVWITAYVCRMPVVNAPGPFTVAAMLVVLVIGGFLTARYSPRGALASLLAGALSGLLDILILGSLIHDYTTTHDQSLVPSAALWFSGSIFTSALIAGIGGLAAIPFPSRQRGSVSWAAFFALVLAAATLPLITFGGLVTAFHAGLAVPDWPQSYGYNMFLFPLSMMQKNEGNFYEHAHRLMGALVGLTALALAIYLTVADRRWYIKLMPWVVGVAVAIQAVLGGTRVTDKSVTLAIIHGIFAQLVFAAMAVQVAMNTRAFRTWRREPTDGAFLDWLFSGGLLGAVFVQLILGALLRHKDAMLFVHISMAVIVLLAALFAGVRAWGVHSDRKPLARAGVGVLSVVVLQVVLGVIALVFRSGPEGTPTTAGALLTTAHQANGALLLALSAVLAVWSFRLFAPMRGYAEAGAVTPRAA
jgi:cytochrome c oxidase assembly protein subunit 15